MGHSGIYPIGSPDFWRLGLCESNPRIFAKSFPDMALPYMASMGGLGRRGEGKSVGPTRNGLHGGLRLSGYLAQGGCSTSAETWDRGDPIRSIG